MTNKKRMCFFHTTPKEDCTLCDGYGNKPKVNQSHNNQQNKLCEVSGNSSHD